MEARGPRSAPEAQERLELTDDFWRLWLRHGEFPDHPWRIHLQRSALVLKGLTYNPTGAIVAAATTSLPETPGGERNWDYRYTWIRDSTFSLWALHTLGFDQEARDFMRFILTVCRDHPELQIMYGIGHERELPESTLDHLSGYDWAKPVRIGNGAFDQRQNDVWGALIDSVYLHEKALAGSGSEADRELIRHQVEKAIECFPLPDQGIWESRGEPQHYVSSKVSMWVAADRGARMAREIGREDFADRWEAMADEFKEEICEKGCRDGIFRQHYDTDALDASLLLIPLYRFLPGDDPRIVATVNAIADDLTEEGLVLRYTDRRDRRRPHRRGGHLPDLLLLARLGALGDRRARPAPASSANASSRPRATSTSTPRSSTPKSGRHLGNFPQAFTHLALINAVSHVIADEQNPDHGAKEVFTEMGGVHDGGLRAGGARGKGRSRLGHGPGRL